MNSRRGALTDVLRTAALVAVIASVACSDSLPEQDLRILEAAPVAKLSAALLWKDYADDALAAERRYRGRAVELTGDAQGFVETATPRGPDPTVSFLQGDSGRIAAHLLPDRASEAQASLQTAPRLTLRCFVDGLDTARKVLTIRSCIKP